jgi:hypothetical protein
MEAFCAIVIPIVIIVIVISISMSTDKQHRINVLKKNMLIV